MSHLGSFAFPSAGSKAAQQITVELFVFQREGGRRLRLKNVGVLGRLYKRTVLRVFLASVPDAIVDVTAIVSLRVAVRSLTEVDNGSKVGILDVRSGLVELEQVYDLDGPFGFCMVTFS